MAYLEVADLKAYEGVEGDGDDEFIATLIAAAQAFIEGPEGAGRRFEVTANSTRRFDAIRDVEGRTLCLDEDLAAINTVTNGDGVVINASQRVTEPRNETPIYAVRLKGSSGLTWTYEEDPEDAIAVSGKWGYSVTPPADIVQACRRLAAWLYRQRETGREADQVVIADGVRITPTSLPKDVMTVLVSYRRLV